MSKYKIRDMDGILRKFNESKDKKRGIVVISYIWRDQNVQQTEMGLQS